MLYNITTLPKTIGQGSVPDAPEVIIRKSHPGLVYSPYTVLPEIGQTQERFIGEVKLGHRQRPTVEFDVADLFIKREICHV